MTIPNNEYWSIGWFDQSAWEEVSDEPDDFASDPEPGTFRLSMTIMKPIANRPECGTPKIDQLIAERAVQVGGSE